MLLWCGDSSKHSIQNWFLLAFSFPLCTGIHVKTSSQFCDGHVVQKINCDLSFLVCEFHAGLHHIRSPTHVCSNNWWDGEYYCLRVNIQVLWVELCKQGQKASNKLQLVINKKTTQKQKKVRWKKPFEKLFYLKELQVTHFCNCSTTDFDRSFSSIDPTSSMTRGNGFTLPEKQHWFSFPTSQIYRNTMSLA